MTRFEDLGHYPQIEDPGRVADALQARLGRLTEPLDPPKTGAILSRFARTVVDSITSVRAHFSPYSRDCRAANKPLTEGIEESWRARH